MDNTTSFYNVWEDAYAVDQASKGFTKDGVVGQLSSFGIKASYSPTTVVNLIRKDEIVNSCINTKVDAVIGAGYSLHGTNKRKISEVQNLFDENNWDVLVRQIYWNLFAFGNAFIEIVRDGEGKPKELHLLETTEMEILDPDGHGEPTMYLQRPAGLRQVGNTKNKASPSVVEFPPEDVVHLRLDRLTTSLWGEIPIRPLDQYLGIKLHIKNHIWTLFKQNLFRSVLEFPEKVDEDDVKKSVAFYKDALEDNKKPFVWYGGVSQKVLMTFEDGPRYIDMINKIDMAILSQMQVPPIMAGLPDNSGRASGEQETYKSFNTHIRALLRTVAAMINGELFKKLGATGVTYQPGEIDKKSEKDIIEILVSLKALGAKASKLEDYARAQGLDLPKNFFDPAFYKAPSKQDNDKMTNVTSPSREGKTEGTMNKRVGTGSDGETREEQMITQAFDRLQVHSNPKLEQKAKELFGVIKDA